MRKRALIVAATSVAALAGAADTASATTMKTLAGATVASGAGFSLGLKAGTSFVLSSAAGNITCPTSNWLGNFDANPGFPSVRGKLTSLTFINCTDTIPFVTVSSFSVSPGTKTVAATYLGSASTFAVYGLAFTSTFTNGSSCTYAPTTDPATAQHDSTTSPWNNEYKFNGVPMTRTGGTTMCSPTATWTATYLMTSGGAGVTIQP